MEAYRYLTLRDMPKIREKAASWFHQKWGVPEAAYLECMDAYLSGKMNLDGSFACRAIRLWAVLARSKMIFMTGRI